MTSDARCLIDYESVTQGFLLAAESCRFLGRARDSKISMFLAGEGRRFGDWRRDSV